MNGIEALKAALPSIPDMAPGLKKETDNSECGPCPLCGGTDRLVYKIDEQKFWCRHCKPKGGDVIDLYRLIYNKTLPELFDEFNINDKTKPSLKLQPEPAQKKKEGAPSKKNLYPQQDRWKDIINGKNTNFDPIYRLAKRRGINKELFLKAYNDNKIRFVKHRLKDQEELSSVACQYYELDGDKKVLAIQMLSVDGLSYSDTEKKDKVFTYGSENEEGCFFQIGKNIEQAKIIILFESVINAFSCAECFPSACCLAIGSSIYTKKVKSLRKYRDNDVQIICFLDNDKEGQKALNKISIILGEKTKTVKWPKDTPNKYDINDLLKDGKHKDIISMINNAEFVKIDESGTEEAGEDLINEFNKKHAVIILGNKVRILYEIVDISGYIDPQFLSLYDFKLLYYNKKIPNPNYNGKKGQSKTISIADAWLASAKRREYQGIVFDPNNNDDGFYNLYRGLAYKPVNGDWSLYKEHLFHNICNDNLLHYEWLMAWMARIVQDPGGEKPGTAIVLQGLRGVGKGVFVEIFGEIFGHHYQLVTKQAQATGRFNSHLKNCLLLYLDEAFFAGDKTIAGVLKSLITSKHHLIELKGKDAIKMANHINCIIASNNDWVVSVGRYERRFLVLNVADTQMQNHNYFKKIDEQMYKKGGISAMLYDLLALDITKFNLREAPKTEGLLNQLVYNFTSFQKFWFEQLLGDFSTLGGEEGIQREKLFNDYIYFCDKVIKEKRPLVPAIFGRKLVEFSDVNPDKRKTISGEKQKRLYVFSDKRACRKFFEKKIGLKIPWKKFTQGRFGSEVNAI